MGQKLLRSMIMRLNVERIIFFRQIRTDRQTQVSLRIFGVSEIIIRGYLVIGLYEEMAGTGPLWKRSCVFCYGFILE